MNKYWVICPHCLPEICADLCDECAGGGGWWQTNLKYDEHDEPLKESDK